MAAAQLPLFDPGSPGARPLDPRKGEVYTRGEVVDFMLDALGYKPERALHERVLLEPSFGGGSFLCAAVGRLLASFAAHGGDVGRAYGALRDCVRAVEIDGRSFDGTRSRLAAALEGSGVVPRAAGCLLDAWMVKADFLLADLDVEAFDFVVGNPPYVRRELIDSGRMMEYRSRYRTIYDRADLYVPFIERSLDLLSDDGALAFICSDRWMKNRYGGPLREKASGRFSLAGFVDMKGTEAFLSNVTAYPSIVLFERRKARGPSRTRVPDRPVGNVGELKALGAGFGAGRGFAVVEGAADGGGPWLLDFPSGLGVLRRVESRFPPIEGQGCRVGVGVATGADRVYVADRSVDVEEGRKLPILLAHDVKTGEVRYRGRVLVNPYDRKGGLVDLRRHPRLARYFRKHADTIKGRHVAKRNPSAWFRTIDRVDPDLAGKPKLLVPDIKGRANVVLDKGGHYPHHNLYFVLSEDWPLEALRAVLRSSLGTFMVGMYSVPMRGGYLRYQAQYLRRVRLPAASAVGGRTLARLAALGASGEGRDAGGELDDLVFGVYGLTGSEAGTVLEFNGRVG